MKNLSSNAGARALDIVELIFLVTAGLFALFYFVNAGFRNFINYFYGFSKFAFRNYPYVTALYVINFFIFIAGIHALYVIIFETRITGSKLRMHEKLERFKDRS